jgi:hypothetical protein
LRLPVEPYDPLLEHRVRTELNCLALPYREELLVDLLEWVGSYDRLGHLV